MSSFIRGNLKKKKKKPKLIGKVICGHEKCKRVVEGGTGGEETEERYKLPVIGEISTA